MVELTREIHNESYRFPANPTETPLADKFMVSESAINLTAAVTWFLTCPAGASTSPKLMIADPGGNEFESTYNSQLTVNGSSGDACTEGPTAGSNVRGTSNHAVENATAGEWTIRSSGQFGGTVTVVVFESYLEVA